MIKVGILPTTRINMEDNPYNDVYMFSNVLVKRIFEAGATPIGILLHDGKLDIESLKMCDAFVIGGGRKIEPYFLEAINYAITNKKPLLGICLGMQAIGVYSYLESLLLKDNKELSIDNFKELFKKTKEDGIRFLKPVENHYKEKITRSNADKNKHKISLNESSKLYPIYKKKEMDVISMHRYALDKPGDNVLINCFCGDIIEGLEYKDLFILGIQWHPELEENYNEIFKALIKEALKK